MKIMIAAGLALAATLAAAAAEAAVLYEFQGHGGGSFTYLASDYLTAGGAGVTQSCTPASGYYGCSGAFHLYPTYARVELWSLPPFVVGEPYLPHVANAAFALSDVGAPGSYVSNGSTLKVTLIQEPAAVPEPGVWAMMILGFGAVGALLRRRPVALA